LLQLEFLKHLKFSACSGLIQIKNLFFTISDDQLALEIFSQISSDHSFFQLIPGQLPAEPRERKKLKPDFEALAFIEDIRFFPFGALLAIPSGSTPNRSQGALLVFGKDQELPSEAVVVDFSLLYQHLTYIYRDLNIEGALIKGSTFKLFQRGNGPTAKNAVIDLDLHIFLQELSQTQKISAESYQKSTDIQLPILNGDILGFTDAASISPDSSSPIWFLAAAEKTISTFDDGPFSGAVLGCLNSDMEIIHIFNLDCAEKPEGLWIDSVNPKEFYIVTDADDHTRPSSLFRGKLPEILNP
jgi:hypothetical protein